MMNHDRYNVACFARAPMTTTLDPLPECHQSSNDRQFFRRRGLHIAGQNSDKRYRDRARADGMSELTQVELFWLKKRIENWIRFGRVAQETILDRNRRVVSFIPGSIFAPTTGSQHRASFTPGQMR